MLAEIKQDAASVDALFLAKVRELEKTAERDRVRALQALISSIDTPIPLHPIRGVLEAEIGVQAPLPLAAGSVPECMVAGAGFVNFRIATHRRGCHCEFPLRFWLLLSQGRRTVVPGAEPTIS